MDRINLNLDYNGSNKNNPLIYLNPLNFSSKIRYIHDLFDKNSSNALITIFYERISNPSTKSNII